ncbi:MAG: AMIN domain-containing protein [Candidatus Rokubacteria bacterium]|nr:AMIN domain-containing protein [Candidatus Rokubacteria bacterium]
MKALRVIPGLLIAFGVALALVAPAATVQGATELARLSDVTVSSQPDAITVFVKTSREPKYNADLIDGPVRLVVDLADTVYGWRKTPLAVGVGPLKEIRGSQYRKGITRVVFEMTRKTGYAIREEADGLAVVIPTAALPAAPRVSRAAAVPKIVAAASAATAAPVAAPAPTATPAPEPPRAAPVQVAQAAPQAPAAAARQGGAHLISLDFKDADAVNLLRILAAESGRNIVIGDDVKGKMSISLRNVPWELALDTVLETRGLKKVEKDGVLRIVTNEQLLKERETTARLQEAKLKAETEQRAKAAEAALKEQEAIDKRRAAEQALEELRARGPLREETIRLSYANPEELAATLQGILGIPAEGVQAQIAPPPPPGGLLPTAEAPFSALYGPKQVVGPPPGPAAEVLSKGITIRAHKPTNSIYIRHYDADLERIKKLIREKFDIPLPQVKIEARMEILDRTDLFIIGVQWGGGGTAITDKFTLAGRGFTSNQAVGAGIAPVGIGSNVANSNATLTNLLPVSATTGLPVGGNLVNLPLATALGGTAATTGVGGISFGIIGSRLNVNLALEALKSEGKTRTLARPEVVTVENNKAMISLGEEIPYATVSSAGTQIQFKEALLKLEVTPTVVREPNNVNKIKMKIVVENNSRGATVDLGGSGQPPAINKRKAETEVLVKEGERLVIGGVANNTDQEEVRKIPVFGDIPFLGWLFKQRSTNFTGRELVVFITPSILATDQAKAQASPAPTK